MASDSQTRIFTKSTPNDKVTVYLAKQDFVDRLTSIDPIEGVITVDSNSLQGGKVFAHVLSAFRYGREDMDVMGLQCRKDIHYSWVQVYPRTEQKALTPLQEELIRQLGANAHPFCFELPPGMADTVLLVSSMREKDKQCGVSYELKVYIADNKEDKPQAGNSVRLGIRKLTFAPEETATQPKDVVVRTFILSSGISDWKLPWTKRNITTGRRSPSTPPSTTTATKSSRGSVMQYTSLHLHDDTTTSVELCQTEFMDGFPIEHNQTGVCKVHHITPSLSACSHKLGVALDGNVIYDDTHLASSTVVSKDSQRENVGIVVSYAIKVRLILGFGTKDLSLELPFTLTYPSQPAADQTQAPFTGPEAFSFEPFARFRVDGRQGGDAED